VEELFPSKPERVSDLMAVVDAGLTNIKAVAATVRLIGSAPNELRDTVAGFGELWSTQILSVVLEEAEKAEGKKEEKMKSPPHDYVFIDARRFLTVEPPEGFRPLTVDYEESGRRLQTIIQKITNERRESGKKECPDAFSLVITGFVCRNKNGGNTTLQRDGSDFTAAIVGKLLMASAITIWTDVVSLVASSFSYSYYLAGNIVFLLCSLGTSVLSYLVFSFPCAPCH